MEPLNLQPEKPSIEFRIERHASQRKVEAWTPDDAVLQEYRWSLEYLAAGSKGCLLALRKHQDLARWIVLAYALSHVWFRFGGL